MNDNKYFNFNQSGNDNTTFNANNEKIEIVEVPVEVPIEEPTYEQSGSGDNLYNMAQRGARSFGEETLKDMGVPEGFAKKAIQNNGNMLGGNNPIKSALDKKYGKNYENDNKSTTPSGGTTANNNGNSDLKNNLNEAGTNAASKALSGMTGVPEPLMKAKMNDMQKNGFKPMPIGPKFGGNKNNMFNRPNGQGQGQTPGGTGGLGQGGSKPSGLSSMLGGAKDKASGAADAKAKAEKAKLIVKTAKIWLPALGIVIGIFVFALIVCTVYEYADQAIDGVVDKGESFLNLLAGNGFITTSENITNKINQANSDCSDCKLGNDENGIDKGILYATVNDNAYIGTGSYETNAEDSGSSEPDLTTDYLIDKKNIRSFYTMKENMLGDDIDDPGTMLNSLVGYERPNVTCVLNTVKDRGNATVAIGKYALNSLIKNGNAINSIFDASLVKGMNPSILGGFDTIKNMGILVKNIVTADSFRTQGSDYFYSQLKEANFAIDQSSASKVYDDIKITYDEIDNCKNMVDANGKHMEAKVTEGSRFIDYELYYKYISRVYVPVVYYSVWDTYDDTKKASVIKETWSDIVNRRNDYYAANGINNKLSYVISPDGNFSASLSEGATFLGGGFYMSDIPVGTAGTGWKQGGNSPWASILLGSSTCRSKSGGPCNMAYIGCYVTSIATLMANSGTQLNVSNFDPGVLATTLKNNGAFTSGGSLQSHSWQSLAPNFVAVSNLSGENLKGKSKAEISSIVASHLSKGYYVILHVKNGGHFVAVVGIENGRIVISDPAGRVGSKVYFDDNSIYPEGTITGIRVFRDTTKS